MPKPVPIATMVGRGLWPRRLHGKATEKPPRVRKRATGGTYATAYDACTEIANFQIAKRSTKVALRGNHVACLLIMFCYGRLAMPCTDVRCKARHSSFLRRGAGLCKGRRGNDKGRCKHGNLQAAKVLCPSDRQAAERIEPMKQKTDIIPENRLAPAECWGDMSALCFCGGRHRSSSNFLHRLKSYLAFTTLYATVGTANGKKSE